MNDFNPYQPPKSRLDSSPTEVNTGGSIESALVGDYSFKIGDVLSEAWERTAGAKLLLLGSMILVGIVGYVVQLRAPLKIIAAANLQSAH